MNSPYVDSHVHFWNPGVIDYPWLSGAPAISRPTFPADLEEARRGVIYELAGIVFVEADCEPAQALREAEWVSSLTAQEPRIRGIVAHAPLQNGEAVRPQLAALQALPLVKSIRRLIQSEPLGFSTGADFVRGVQLLPNTASASISASSTPNWAMCCGWWNSARTSLSFWTTWASRASPRG